MASTSRERKNNRSAWLSLPERSRRRRAVQAALSSCRRLISACESREGRRRKNSAAGLIYLSGIAGRRSSVLLSGSTIIPTDSSAVTPQERLCSRGRKDHTARSGFSHELNSDQAEMVLSNGAISQFVRRFPFLLNSKLFRVRQKEPSSPSLRYSPEKVTRMIFANPPGL